ncbi:leucine-rich repeat-containing protein 19 [Heteronotia binoei]|uniref:leucine-rich repeat-containing protein 19 n=1 Tax=Heteronotia binoei TaxID=13085 RepID=UPI00292CBB9E|nr:leucine-rich repeat-containing protein 19 [Heteronotia binoei]
MLSNNNFSLSDNLTIILHKNPNITELYLNNNTIPILHSYTFCNLSKLTILDVSNNSIQTVEQAAFAGLNQLTALHLQNNEIAHLDSSVFVFLKSLKILNLQNNNLGHFEIEVSLNLTTVTLFGNPWNCSCGLLSLQSWLNNSQLIIENEKNTTCTSPDSLKTQPIKTALLSNCNRKEETEAITKLYSSINSSNDTGASGYNDTDRKLSYSDFPPIGKSWKFLIGVFIVIVTTTMLIITAIKVPVWYRHMISYNHSRLDEDESGMFEENFSTDMCHFPPGPNTNENDSIVIFEQFHTFVPEEDGFIEDKYIDT